MPVTFVLGRAGAGKTEFCLSQIAAALDGAPAGPPLILLAPEQASLQMEQELVRRSARGGYTGAQVYSFSTLALRVLEEVGGAARPLTPSARRMALRLILSQQRPALLPTFGRAIDSPGFLRQLETTLAEFAEAELTPGALRVRADDVADAPAAAKLKALADIWSAYESWRGDARRDAATQMRAVRAALRACDWLSNARIWVDGFAHFTGQEAATLIALAQRAGHVWITLLLDAWPRSGVYDDAVDLFAATRRTALRLAAQFEAASVPLCAPVVFDSNAAGRFSTAPELAALERDLAREWGLGAAPGPALPAPAVAQPDPHRLLMRDFDSPRAELRAAARAIRRRVLGPRADARFGDFAVITRELEPYADLVAEVFTEYEIPYFLDRRRNLAAHPLARLLSALFEAVQRDFPADTMIALLRSELTPLTRPAAELLEAIVRRHAVRGREHWLTRAEWDFVRFTDLLPAATPAPGRDEWLQSLHAGRAKLFLALDVLAGPFAAREALSGSAWARRISDALHRLDVAETLDAWIRDAELRGEFEAAALHRAAWETLVEVLSDLHKIIGAQPTDFRVIVELINEALATRTAGIAPPGLQQVLVSSIERSRHPRVRHAWVFGFNDGQFPMTSSPRGLLTWRDRDALAAGGLDALPQQHDQLDGERLLAYIALTRASESLTISYSHADAAGAPLEPSRWLRDLPAAGHHAPAPGPEWPVTLHELARHALQQPAATPPDPAIAALLSRAQRTPPLAQRLTVLLRGARYDNHPAPLPASRGCADAAITWSTSATELNSYLACPFQHFLRYGLRLNVERGPRPLPLEIGTLVHEVLARTINAARAANGLRTWTSAVWDDALRAELQAAAADRPADLRRRQPGLWHWLTSLEPLLQFKLREAVARWERGQFLPLVLEWSFGAANGGRVQLDGYTVELRGAIDRIDLAETAAGRLLLVIDYKSSPAGAWRNADVLVKEPLQAFLYSTLAPRAPGAEGGAVAGVLISPNYIKHELEPLPLDCGEDQSRARELEGYKPRGILTPAAAEALDPSLPPGARSPVASIALKKDKTWADADAFHKNCDVVDPADFIARQRQALATLRFAAVGVAGGDISIAPLLHHKTLACYECEFASVCRFERGRNPMRRAEAELPTRDTSTEPGAADVTH